MPFDQWTCRIPNVDDLHPRNVALAKPPIVLDADPDTVLRTLEAHMRSNPVPQPV